jgi:hypothetical protein
MCHRFDFRDRLGLIPRTLTPADLLATKLQVVQMTDREYKDIMCLLLDHAIGTTDEQDVINGNYLAKLASDDWGVYMTFKKTIQNVLDAMDQYNLTSEQQQAVQKKAEEILDMIEGAPKTMRWKLRARLGEKVPWYEVPEADREIVN